MCGIAGYTNNHNFTDSSSEVILRMLTRIHYRGPDECGYYVNNGTAIGNVRLSIIDLASGQQPLATQNGRYWIAYNGEVFNYLELREHLISKGHVFDTHCDTEVVVHLYEEYGSDCLNMLNGQFAIAIYDEINDELFLARDRVGIRPLFYTQKDGALLFASEIKSLFEYPGINRKISNKGLSQVFTFWVAIPPQTIFEGINELPPGHYLKFRQGKIDIQSYWKLNFAGSENGFKGTFDEAKEEFGRLLRDSVILRLRSDVPVAAYLSGGLDSSATTALIKEVAPGHLNTFSIGFADKDFDETSFQQSVSNYFNTNHHSVAITGNNIAEWFPQVVYHAEVPLLRTSPAPMFGLSKLVRDNNIKVVITGEGADEALAGYNIFKETIIRHFWAKYPQSKIRPVLLKKLYPYIPSIANGNLMALKLFFGFKLSETQSPGYSHLLRWNNTGNLKKFFSSDVTNSLAGYQPVEDYLNTLAETIDNYSPLQKAQYIETSLFMSGYLLAAQGDRMAMANSVEGRYPFLDYRLLEFCASLPDDFKLKGLNEKYLLKEFIKGRIPDEVVNRSKQAYRAPISQAFFSDVGKTYVNEVLSDEKIDQAGIFNKIQIGNLLSKMNSGLAVSEIENMALCGIISTQLLYKQFIEEFKPLKMEELIKGHQRNKNLITCKE